MSLLQQQQYPQNQIISKEVDNKGRLFVKYWLITSPDVSVKNNGETWGVHPDTIDNNIRTAIGTPLVLYMSPMGYLDHPEYYAQDHYKVGTITDVVKMNTASGINDKTYAAIAEITDPELKQVILSDSDRIPPYVSPAILPAYGIQDENAFKLWKFAHLAIVGNPAYGPRAKILSKCSGDAMTCTSKLRTAIAKAVSIKEIIDALFSSLTQKTATSNQTNNMSTNVSDTQQSTTQQAEQQPQKQNDPLGEVLEAIRERQKLDEESKQNSNQEQPQQQQQQAEQKQESKGPEEPPDKELDYKAEYENNQKTITDLKKQVELMQNELKKLGGENSQTVQSLKQQLTQMQAESNRNRLRVLVPRELFMNESGVVDEKAYNKEIQMRLEQGYPSDVLKDDILVEIYSAKLQNLDNQRAAAPTIKTASALDIRGFSVPRMVDITEINMKTASANPDAKATRADIEELRRVYGIADQITV